MATTYLGLGSNLGNRKRNLRTGMERLATYGTVGRCSSIYQTEPWEVEGRQPDFLNMAVEFETSMPATDLLVALKKIEIDTGRKPDTSNLPRELDIDILLYDDLVVDDAQSGLILPHPEMLGRAFVLVPAAEIAPSKFHPLTGKSLAEMSAALSDKGVELWGNL